jgi:predicted DNA-binding mobile mystery protein A
VREALGMTGAERGQRMGLTQAAAVSMEFHEAKGTIQLDSLRKAAKAMDCRLVYALVPKQSPDKIVEKRRRGIAIKELLPVLIGKSPREYRDLIAAYGETVKRNRLWRDG